MLRVHVLSLSVLMSATLGAGAQNSPRHPHMHHALHELREARTELKEAAHDFGGHRVMALEAVDFAIKQLDIALKGANDNIKGTGKRDPDLYKKYSFHPHIHHAIHELKEARRELKEAKHDFDGHRADALRAVDAAIVQLELALKFDKR